MYNLYIVSCKIKTLFTQINLLINRNKIENILYNDLIFKINNNLLEVNKSYRITDFQTVHYLVDSLGGKHGINTGVNEALIIQAISTNKIDKVAISELYPKDIIWYDFDSTNHLTDEGFSTAGVIVAGFKGMIYFRHDTILNNQVGNDFRNVKYRRWECNPPTWDGVTTFGAKAYVKYNGWLYCSFSASNLNNIPALNSEFWVRLLDLSNGRYWNANPTSQNGIVSGTTYKDCLLFEPLTSDPLEQYIRCYENNTIITSKTNNSKLFNIVIYAVKDEIYTAYMSFQIDGGQNITLGGNYGGGKFGYIQNCQISSLYNSKIDSIYDVIAGDIGYQQGSYFTRIIIGSMQDGIFNEIDNCIIGNAFDESIINEMFNSTLKNNVSYCNVIQFNNCIVPSNFKHNTVKKVNNVNFTGATHAVANYDCDIFTNSSSVVRLEYVNGSNVTVNVAPNS